MSTETPAANQSGGNDRRIDSDRLTRALTEPMAVDYVAPCQYDVANTEDTTRTVDIEAGTCQCGDYEYRGSQFICKHVLRAAVHAVFVEGVRSRLQARTVAAVRELGCPHAHGSITDEHDCGGPLGVGAFPCPQCVEATPGEWSAWVTLVGDGPDASAVDRGAAVATDGGEETDDEPGTKTVSGCATCSGYAYGGDDQCPECQQRGVEPVEEVPL